MIARPEQRLSAHKALQHDWLFTTQEHQDNPEQHASSVVTLSIDTDGTASDIVALQRSSIFDIDVADTHPPIATTIPEAPLTTTNTSFWQTDPEDQTIEGGDSVNELRFLDEWPWRYQKLRAGSCSTLPLPTRSHAMDVPVLRKSDSLDNVWLKARPRFLRLPPTATSMKKQYREPEHVRDKQAKRLHMTNPQQVTVQYPSKMSRSPTGMTRKVSQPGSYTVAVEHVRQVQPKSIAKLIRAPLKAADWNTREAMRDEQLFSTGFRARYPSVLTKQLPGVDEAADRDITTHTWFEMSRRQRRLDQAILKQEKESKSHLDALLAKEEQGIIRRSNALMGKQEHKRHKPRPKRTSDIKKPDFAAQGE